MPYTVKGFLNIQKNSPRVLAVFKASFDVLITRSNWCEVDRRGRSRVVERLVCYFLLGEPRGLPGFRIGMMEAVFPVVWKVSRNEDVRYNIC
ncbi:hypothetical protein TNCV_4197311 [Trichonephila clavipes]|nr:hypothetical protein TNCV_4197311 [Trichonephila clavipes]